MFKKNLFFIGRDKLIRTNIIRTRHIHLMKLMSMEMERCRELHVVFVWSTKQQYLNFFRRRTKKKLQGKNQGKAEKFLLS